MVKSFILFSGIEMRISTGVCLRSRAIQRALRKLTIESDAEDNRTESRPGEPPER